MGNQEIRMQHIRWINYPAHITPEFKAKYEVLADTLEAAATEPICLVWANPDEDWTDENGVNPDRDCLLVCQQIETDTPGEATYGLNLSTHKLLS
jgi:hypothetical protein